MVMVCIILYAIALMLWPISKEGKIELVSLGDLMERDKVAKFSQYLSYVVLLINVSVLVTFLVLAIFTQSESIFNNFARTIVSVSILGVIIFFFSLKVNKSEPKSNLLLQFSFLFAYFFSLLQLTGGTNSPLFPLFYVFVTISAFYSIMVSSI